MTSFEDFFVAKNDSESYRKATESFRSKFSNYVGRANQVKSWVEGVTGMRFPNPSFRKSLENGGILAALINTIKPGSVPARLVKAPRSKIMANSHFNERVAAYTSACSKLGAMTFETNDLRGDKYNMFVVVDNLESLKLVTKGKVTKVGRQQAAATRQKEAKGFSADVSTISYKKGPGFDRMTGGATHAGKSVHTGATGQTGAYAKQSQKDIKLDSINRSTGQIDDITRRTAKMGISQHEAQSKRGGGWRGASSAKTAKYNGRGGSSVGGRSAGGVSKAAFCSACGTKFTSATARFCSACGAPR